MNEIDFKQLRRQERKNARSSSQRGNKNGCSNGANESSNQVRELQNESNGDSVTSESPIDTLLPQNKLTERHRIHPPRHQMDSVYYTPNFLNEETCREILDWLKCLPEYSAEPDASRSVLSEREESKRHNGKWTRLKHARRKVALFDSTLQPLPPLLSRLTDTLINVGAFSPETAPNHVLVNEYQAGEGIMAHTDGPAYECRTATISIGGEVIFKLWHRHRSNSSNNASSGGGDVGEGSSTKPAMEALLHGTGSLILFTNDAYTNHCHEIEETMEDVTSDVCGNEGAGVVVKRGYRMSLTFRCKKL